MNNKKSKHVSQGFILLISAIILIVAVFGVSFAWFTASQSVKMNGTSPIVSLEVKKAGTDYESGTVYAYTSGDLASFTFKSTSTINVFIRARVTCNWADNDLSRGSVYDYLTFTLNGTWYSNVAPSGTANQKLEGGWIYFNATSSAITSVAPSQPNPAHSIFTSVSGSLPAGATANIQVYVEAVQANNVGLNKFGTAGTDFPNAWLAA